MVASAVSNTVTVLSLVALDEAVRTRIESVDACVRLTVAAGAFDDELRRSYGEHVMSRFRQSTEPVRPRLEPATLLASADVVLVGFPVPLDLRARAPRLRWVHQTTAGASNARHCDIWDTGVTVTTSRGLGNIRAIAEYVLGAFAYFARGFHHAARERETGVIDRSRYHGVQLAGQTVCVLGAGGIGREVGRLCSAAGMRVVGISRTPPPTPPDGFDELRGPDDMHDMLATSLFIAVCCQLTPDTERLLDRRALAALPDGAVLVNVARGEIVDEEAVRGALVAGRLRGAALDVYVGEFEHDPPAELWRDDRVLVTPHVSSVTDRPSPGAIDLFCDNLAAFCQGRPLNNVIEWDRGY